VSVQELTTAKLGAVLIAWLAEQQERLRLQVESGATTVDASFWIEEQQKIVDSMRPILKDAYAAYECKLFDHHTYGDHEWFIGEIVALHIEDGLFKEDGVLDIERIKLALYLGSDNYITASSKEIRHLDRKEYGKV